MRRLAGLLMIVSLAGCGAVDEAKDKAKKESTKAAVNLGCKGAAATIELSGGSPSDRLGRAAAIIKPEVERLRSSNPDRAAQADEFIAALDKTRAAAQRAAEAEAAKRPDAMQLKEQAKEQAAEAARIANDYGLGDCATALDIPLS